MSLGLCRLCVGLREYRRLPPLKVGFLFGGQFTARFGLLDPFRDRATEPFERLQGQSNFGGDHWFPLVASAIAARFATALFKSELMKPSAFRSFVASSALRDFW